MGTNIIAITAILAATISVYLNYLKEIKTKKKEEIYLRKLTYYENLIANLVESLQGKNPSGGRDFIKLYHQSFLYSNDEVILNLNKILALMKENAVVASKHMEPILAKILVECRKDLESNTKIRIGDYKGLFPD